MKSGVYGRADIGVLYRGLFIYFFININKIYSSSSLPLLRLFVLIFIS